VIRVLLADDQELVRLGFRLILEREVDLEVVGEAADGAEALALCERLNPHVVLMDIRMPVLDGVAATSTLLTQEDPPKVLILTTFDLDELVYAGLEAGASGFLLKDVRAEVLADAIRTVHGGDALLAPSVTRRLISTFVASRRRAAPCPEAITSLTPREREVLGLIATGLSNTEIAERLVVSEATVKTHVGRVFTKVGARDRAQAVVIAYESGLAGPVRAP
jgi:DNA-binding NarL/FixJ family response regulator